MSKKGKQLTKNACVRGFLPDFSKYLERHYPVEAAYTVSALIDKLGKLLQALVTTQNPAQDLQNNGLCKKLEKMSPSKDKTFFGKIDFPQGPIYYAAFGDNPYRIVFGIDSNTRRAYFLALITDHSVR